MRDRMQNTGKKTISRSFLTGLLIIVLIGFIASIGFSWMLQTRLQRLQASALRMSRFSVH